VDAGVRVLLEAVRLALGEEAAPQLVGQAEREGVPRAGARRHAGAKPRGQSLGDVLGRRGLGVYEDFADDGAVSFFTLDGTGQQEGVMIVR
jgi:hypothetical protein